MKYFLVIIAFIPVFAFPQIIDKSLENVNLDKEFFYIDPLVFSTRDSLNARLDLYIELPLGNVQFKKNQVAGKYNAYIDYSIEIKNSRNEVVNSNYFSETMSNSEDEMKKISEKSVYAIKQFYLAPGNYNLFFVLKDKNNQKEYSKERSITVKDFRKGTINFSDMMLVSSYREDDEGKKEISPIINSNIGNLKDFYLFFEVYNNSSSMVEAVYYYKILDEKNKALMEGTYNYYLDSGVTKKVERINTNLFILGNYKLEIIDKISNELMTSRNLQYRWDFLPVSLKNLDLAISQLIYIASSEELNKIKNAKTKEDKEREFLRFWKDKDPSPGTPRNELMREYYNRIKIANERYSHYVDGWKTDMGMVYIIYGNPSSIERHPFESDSKPYEIWEYYDSKKRFIFVDETGFGDYRLTTPIWDERTKLSF